MEIVPLLELLIQPLDIFGHLRPLFIELTRVGRLARLDARPFARGRLAQQGHRIERELDSVNFAVEVLIAGEVWKALRIYISRIGRAPLQQV